MNFSKNFPVISGPYPFFYRSPARLTPLMGTYTSEAASSVSARPIRLTPLMDTYTSQTASSVSTRPARLIPQKGTYTLHIPPSCKPTISQHPDFPVSACRNVLTTPITVPLHTYFSYASCSCFFTHVSAVPSLQAYSGCLFFTKTNNKQTISAIQEYVFYRLSDTIICL